MMPMVSMKSSTGMPLRTWMFLKTASADLRLSLPPDCAASATLITHAKATAAGPISFIV